MAYYKPQSPLKIGDNFYYPLTTYDQIINKDGTHVTSIADGKNIPYLYSAMFRANEWSGDGPYTQTVMLSPINSGGDINIDSVFTSPAMCNKTTSEETNKTLQSILSMFNEGYTNIAGVNSVTSTLFEKPSSDIEIIWSISGSDFLKSFENTIFTVE